MLIIREPAIRAKTIVVGVVDDRCSGSLAYALVGALNESAKVRIVRVSPGKTSERARLHLPIEVVEVVGDPAEVLAAESKFADLLVIESPIDEAAALVDPLLARLRAATETILVEVDQHGEILRASGPKGSTCAVAISPINCQAARDAFGT